MRGKPRDRGKIVRETTSERDHERSKEEWCACVRVRERNNEFCDN